MGKKIYKYAIIMKHARANTHTHTHAHPRYMYNLLKVTKIIG